MDSSPSIIQYSATLLKRHRPPLRGRLYPYLQRLRGRPLDRYLHQLQDWEQLSPSEFELMHVQRLRSILEYASRNVPFYKDGHRRSSPDAGDIDAWPVLEKEVLQAHFEDLKAQPLPRRVVIRRTSGSTGSPACIATTPAADTWSWAHRYRGLLWHGIPIGVPSLRMSHQRRFLRDLVKGEKCVPNVNSPEEVERAARYLIDKRPMLVTGPPSTLFHFARHLRQRGITEPLAPFARVGGEQLYEFQRTEIESFLSARAINSYGSTETGALAGECPAGSLHVYADHVHLEIFRGDEPAGPGEFGDIVATTLRNTAMPLVRYRVSDRGRLSPERCRCGLPHPVLTDLQARSDDQFRASDGSLHHGAELVERLKEFFADSAANSVRQIQFGQKDARSWEVWMEISDSIRPADVQRDREVMEDRLARIVRETFGADCSLQVHFGKSLPREPRKFSYYCPSTQ